MRYYVSTCSLLQPWVQRPAHPSVVWVGGLWVLPLRCSFSRWGRRLLCPKKAMPRLSVHTGYLDEPRSSVQIKMKHSIGAPWGSVGWASDSVSAQVMVSWLYGFKPHIGLCADGVEPAWDSLSLSLSKWINLKKKKVNKKRYSFYCKV